MFFSYSLLQSNLHVTICRSAKNNDDTQYNTTMNSYISIRPYSENGLDYIGWLKVFQKRMPDNSLLFTLKKTNHANNFKYKRGYKRDRMILEIRRIW